MIERINELNRLLIAMTSLGVAGPGSFVSLESVLRECAETVQGGTLPNHDLTVEFGVMTQLVFVQEGGIAMTDSGAEFLQLNPEGFYDLTLEQRQVLTRNHYFDGSLKSTCRDALIGFNISPEQDCLIWSELDDKALQCPTWLLDHLCQLEVLERMENGFRTTNEMSAAAFSFLDEPKGLTEEKLRAMLAERIALGDIGEELVIKFERQRLADLGAVVESHCVRRIGNVRVDAGYDVDSYDGASSSKVFDRHIEVKAAKSKDLHFFWSENEMRVAEKLGDRYWIYFLGGVNTTRRSASQQPLMFQNPIKSIIQCADISKQSQGLLVQAKMRGVTI